MFNVSFKNIIIALVVGVLMVNLNGCIQHSNQQIYHLKSPDEKVDLILDCTQLPKYSLKYDGNEVIAPSSLGLALRNSNFTDHLELLSVSAIRSVNDEYSLSYSKRSALTYSANQQVFQFVNPEGEKLDIEFRLSNDGLAFRYCLPKVSSELKYIISENTSYVLPEHTKAWLQPMSKAKTGWESTNPSYEENYQVGVPIGTASPIGQGWVYPALFKTENAWVLVTEAGIEKNYCGSRLMPDSLSARTYHVGFPQQQEYIFDGPLTPESTTPWYTPWRVIAVGKLKTIMESTLGTDLAPAPNPEVDYTFVKPGIASWSWIVGKDESINFEEQKKYILYAEEMNWSYCLIDVNWDTRIGYNRIHQLADFGKEHGVKLILWYNSAGDWNSTPYEPKDKMLTEKSRASEFQRLQDMGIAGIKVDFFGGDGQSVMAYYQDILEDAAKYELVVNFHGATLPRGWQRTYPNLVTMESVKGFEFVTFSQDFADLQPEHCAILPFTRNVFDPMDFTPMNLSSVPNINRLTSPAFELALPIVFLSAIQHTAESPEGMASQPDFVKTWLREMPVTWDETKFISGYPGKEVIIARRYDTTWYVAGINGQNETKEMEIDLTFGDGNIYLITEDESGFVQKWISTDNNETLKISMKPYGGFVMRFGSN
ncbi:MAG: glycoside hydrolase family 97 catalytic domain-containing protein [Cyclobacteriaceae bacterium]